MLSVCSLHYFCVFDYGGYTACRFLPIFAAGKRMMLAQSTRHLLPAIQPHGGCGAQKLYISNDGGHNAGCPARHLLIHPSDGGVHVVRFPPRFQLSRSIHVRCGIRRHGPH